MSSNATRALKEVEQGSFTHAARIYVERLAFTKRGRFSFLAGLLLIIHSEVGTILMEGVPSASRAPITDPGLIQMAINMLSTGLSIGVAIMAGVVVLAIIDIYEEFVGVAYTEGRQSMSDE